MRFNSTVLGIALAAAVLVPMSALADHDVRPLSGSIDVRIGAPAEPPRGHPSNAGRYERRVVSRWVPGYEERVWVDGWCREKHYRHKHKFKRVCTEGHYESHWVPGHTVEEEQWVWVAYPPPPPPRSGVHVRLSSIF